MPIRIVYRSAPPKRPIVVRFVNNSVRRHKPYGPRAPLQNNFWGDLIRTLRLEQRISQRELCRRCQIQSRTLRKYEEGRALPYIDVIERILGVLGFELEALSKASIEVRYRREEMARRASYAVKALAREAANNQGGVNAK